MAFSVRVRQFDTPVTVEMGQTVLEAALAQGRPYPHGCRSGNCGACKSELLSGEVDMLPSSEYALTDAERRRGLILACRAVPWSDCEVAYLDVEDVAAHPIRRLACRVSAVEPATHDITIIRLEVLSGGPFTFSAGQYVELTFEGRPARDYSMANRPDEATLEFHVRRVAGGAVSPFVTGGLEVGTAVRADGPYGGAYLRERHRGPILLLAGGSGLAPVKSILETALALGMRQPIRLYFGARDERDVYLERWLAALAAAHGNFRFEVVLSAPSGPTRRRTGFLHQAVREDFRDLDGCKAYLAGPPVMVEACTPVLEALGVRRHDIHADPFYTAAEKQQLGVRP